MPSEPRQFYLSPSSINTLSKCPRKWFYRYILHIPEEKSINLIKGSAVHETIESIFRDIRTIKSTGYYNQIFTHAKAVLKKHMLIGKQLPKMTEEDFKSELYDAEYIIKTFVKKLCDNIQMLINFRKAKTPQHAFHVLKPKLMEEGYEDERLKVRGKIDALQVDFEGNTIIVDYKTSNKYKNNVSNDYKVQISIYAYLYFIKHNKLPNLICLNYLRFGESYYFEATPNTILFAIDEIKKAWQFIGAKKEKEDYYKKESKLCEWCGYKEECFNIEKKIAEGEQNIKKGTPINSIRDKYGK